MSDNRKPTRPGGKRKTAAAGIGAAAVVILALFQYLNGGDIDDILGTLTGDQTSGAAQSDNQAAGAGRIAGQNQASLPFDYYVLSLSWSPSFCQDRPDADQCGRGHRFIVHGLWPQFERGFPSDCDTTHQRPARNLLNRYADETTESSGLLAYQWRKHGTCTGLRPADYFDATARAARAVTIPPSLKNMSRDLDVDPRVIEKAFVDANPRFERDTVTIKCRDNKLTEVRICLTTDLKPRKCGKDVIRDCGARALDVPAPK